MRAAGAGSGRKIRKPELMKEDNDDPPGPSCVLRVSDQLHGPVHEVVCPALFPWALSRSVRSRGHGIGVSLLGLGRAEALRSHGKDREIVEEKTSPWGRKFLVSCSINTPDERKLCVLSVWIEEGNAPARSVTAYPKQA